MIKTFDGDDHKYLIKKLQDDKRNYAFCTSKKIDANGNALACQFKCRVDHLVKNIQKGNIHICSFIKNDSTPQERDLRSYYSNTANQFNHREIIFEDILNELALLSGRLNISLNSACSDAMYDFIRKCIRFGVQIGKTIKNPENYLSSRISKPNRESLRRHFFSTRELRTQKKNESIY